MQEARRRMEGAQADLDTAEYLEANRRYNAACFEAPHAEETSKALYAHGVEDPWGHSVDGLLRDAPTDDGPLSGLIPRGALGENYYVPTRYSNGLPGRLPSQAYTERDASESTQHARTVIEAVESRIDKTAQGSTHG